MILSLIIPVYKVEQYIQACISSIYSQNVSENDFEVIIVNDGTPDNSIKLILPLIEKKTNTKIINQENKGLSIARNTGLELACGKYVWFIDSDDWLLPNSLEKVLKTICSHPQIDMIATRLLHHQEGSGYEKVEIFPCMTAKTGREYMFGNNPKGASQRYILRRQFLIENNLKFMPNVYHEDGEFGNKMTYLAQTCYVIPEPIYVYRLRASGSIMSSRKPKMNTDLIKIYQSLLKFAEAHVSTQDYWKFRAQIITCLWRTIDFSRQEIFSNSFKEFYMKYGNYIHMETGILFQHRKLLTRKQYISCLHYYYFPLFWTKAKRIIKIILNNFK